MMTNLAVILGTVLLVMVVVYLSTRGWRGTAGERFKRSKKAQRILYEDALKHIYKCERRKVVPTSQSLAGQLHISVDVAADILFGLQRRKLIEVAESDFRLTREGRKYALHIVRAHRLWERYLADMTGVPETDWHGQAERLEHQLTPEKLDELSAQLGHPTHDPHGDPLPTPMGRLELLGGQSLLKLRVGDRAQIIHVEDEPPSVYARLVELGIFPGMEFQLLSRDAEVVRVLAEGSEKELTHVEASNVTAEIITRPAQPDLEAALRLSELKPGEAAEVVSISRASRSVERRRLMDLGILPGTQISAEFTGPGRDPTAYRVRGALIALRRDQADYIFVRNVREAA